MIVFMNDKPVRINESFIVTHRLRALAMGDIQYSVMKECEIGPDKFLYDTETIAIQEGDRFRLIPPATF